MESVAKQQKVTGEWCKGQDPNKCIEQGARFCKSDTAQN